MVKQEIFARIRPEVVEELKKINQEIFPEVSFSQMIEKLLERVLNDYFRESSQRKE